MNDSKNAARTPSRWAQASALLQRIFHGVARSTRASYLPLGKFEGDEWRRQHDEVCKTIWNVTTLLAGTCVFCLLTLGAPDATLISNDARITIPVTGTAVSYTAFLFFGPLVLIGLTIYLHVFLGYRLRIGADDNKAATPYIFNLKEVSAVLLSGMLFYVMLPFVLAVFAWKALPRPDAPLFVFLTIGVTVIMIVIGLRRFGAESQEPLKTSGRIAVGTLWMALAMCVLCLVVMVPVVARIGRRLVEAQLNGDPQQVTSELADLRATMFPLPARKLQLYGAALDKKSLSELYASRADMRKANLKETDLEGADLTGADLRKADLTKADLAYANLAKSRLEGAILTDAALDGADLRDVSIDASTNISPKWRIVVCALRNLLKPSCLSGVETPWSDLAGVNLRESNLTDVDLTGADLSGADLSKTNLTRTVLRLADLTGTKLPAALHGTDLAGALLADSSAASAANRVAGIRLWNRETDACLEGPADPANAELPEIPGTHPCPASKDPRDGWAARRLNNAHIVIESAIADAAGQKMCLDSSSGGKWVQVWACGDDYPNQWWHVRGVPGGYVMLELRQTKTCLTSPGALPKPNQVANLFLDPCDENVHTQHWHIILS